MGGLVRPLLVLVCACAALAFASAAASAATFCVNSPLGCTGSAESTITNAITAAQASPGRDQIQIAGNHTYDEHNLFVAPGNPVDIVGVGSPQPLITDTASTAATLLEVDDTTSTVANLAFSIPDGATDGGLDMAGALATGIRVTAVGAAPASTAISLFGSGSTLANSSAVLPFSVTSNNTIALSLDGDNEIVRDSTFAGAAAGQISGGSGARLSRDTFTGPDGVEQNGGTGSVVEDSVILVSGSNGSNETGLVVAPNDVSPENLTARNVTVLDAGNHGPTPARGALSVTGGGSGPATLLLLDSIVRGFTTVDLRTDGAGASIDTDYSDWGTSDAVDGGTPVSRGAHDLNVDPGLVNPAGSDFQLAPGSPLIDAGEPGVLFAGESATDFYGAPRQAAGRTPCAFIRDIGAAEFEPGLLAARASGPATGLTRSALTFGSSGSCGPSAQVGIASFGWTFSDGATASGPVVSHAFSKPGAQTAKLTVTDGLGHSASATVNVQVVARRASLRRLKLSPSKFRAGKGTRVSFKLNEAAKVRFTVKQRRAHSRKLKTLRGSFTVRGKSGSNRFHFSGRLRHRKLKPGRYVLVATPGTGATKGKAVSAHFRIVR